MNNNKNKILVYLCIALFGLLGAYLTFIAGNTNKYDSQTRAYKIYPNESYDSDSGTTYQPIYYFKVNEIEYECKAKVGSSSYPDENKNMVYYDSSNPTKCKTEYEKSTSKFAGIICLIATAVMIYFFVIKKPSNSIEESNHLQEFEAEGQHQFEQEKVEKVIKTVGKVQLIFKRVILGIIIAILLMFVLIDTVIFKQTIKARDYVETTATYVDRKSDKEDSLFDEYIYTFKDKQGNEQEVIISVAKDLTVKDEIKLKYNENNPQEYYEEGSTLDKSEIIWYIVKIVALVLLIILFFNKKLLNKISITASTNRV